MHVMNAIGIWALFSSSPLLHHFSVFTGHNINYAFISPFLCKYRANIQDYPCGIGQEVVTCLRLPV